MSLFKRGQYDEAIASLRRATKLKPRVARYHSALGIVLHHQGRLDDAEKAFQRAVTLSPQDAGSLNNLAIVLQTQGRLDDALAAYRRAIELEPEDPELYYNFGCALEAAGNCGEAEHTYRRAVSLRPTYAKALNNLSAVLSDRGKLSEAEGFSLQALQLLPHDPEAHSIFARAHRFEPNDPEIEQLKRLLSHGLISRVERNFLLCALGKAHADIGCYGDAFDYYRNANTEQALANRFDLISYESQIREIKSMFSEKTVLGPSSISTETKMPIFIVGFSRSGKSIVETILLENERVCSMGESTELKTAIDRTLKNHRINELYPHCVPFLAERQLGDIARYYEMRMTSSSPDAKFFVNTLPGNAFYIGLIHAVFPQARIIYCARHPIDNCLFVYCKQYGHGQAYSHDLRDIAHCYNGYKDLMGHWQRLLGPRILEVHYEELVRSSDEVAAQLYEFCAIEQGTFVSNRARLWDDEIGRWRCYKPYLGCLIEILDETAALSGLSNIAATSSGISAQISG